MPATLHPDVYLERAPRLRQAALEQFHREVVEAPQIWRNRYSFLLKQHMVWNEHEVDEATKSDNSKVIILNGYIQNGERERITERF